MELFVFFLIVAMRCHARPPLLALGAELRSRFLLPNPKYCRVLMLRPLSFLSWGVSATVESSS